MADDQQPSADDPIDAEVVPAAPDAAPYVVPAPDSGYTTSGVPTFDSVREKIETRYGTSIGAAELDAETPEGRSVAEQYDARQRAAAEKLKQIRESMNQD
jgi:phage shock protein A